MCQVLYTVSLNSHKLWPAMLFPFFRKSKPKNPKVSKWQSPLWNPGYLKPKTMFLTCIQKMFYKESDRMGQQCLCDQNDNRVCTWDMNSPGRRLRNAT